MLFLLCSAKSAQADVHLAVTAVNALSGIDVKDPELKVAFVHARRIADAVDGTIDVDRLAESVAAVSTATCPLSRAFGVGRGVLLVIVANDEIHSRTFAAKAVKQVKSFNAKLATATTSSVLARAKSSDILGQRFMNALVDWNELLIDFRKLKHSVEGIGLPMDQDPEYQQCSANFYPFKTHYWISIA